MAHPNRLKHVWRGLALLLVAGCAPSGGADDAEVAALVRSLNAPALETEPGEVVHDLGTVLARGQTLRHVFTLRNPSDEPLRILGAEAQTPCCSSVEALAESVPPRGAIEVPVVFKPGFQSGRKRVQFAVTTDDEARPMRVFGLLASLVSEVEVEVLQGSDRFVLLGQAGKQRLRVTCRRVGDEGRSAPEEVMAPPGVTARFTSAAVENMQPDGTIESTIEVDVALPASKAAGRESVDVEFRWPNMLSHAERVHWQAKPCIEAVPSGFVLAEGGAPASKKLLLRSADHPFRVLSIHCDRLSITGTIPHLKDKQHLMQFEVKAHGGVATETATIEIETDHPQQSHVLVSVLAISREAGGRR